MLDPWEWKLQIVSYSIGAGKGALVLQKSNQGLNHLVVIAGQVCLHTPLILAFRRLRQADFCELETSQVYTVRLNLKK